MLGRPGALQAARVHRQPEEAQSGSNASSAGSRPPHRCARLDTADTEKTQLELHPSPPQPTTSPAWLPSPPDPPHPPHPALTHPSTPRSQPSPQKTRPAFTRFPTSPRRKHPFSQHPLKPRSTSEATARTGNDKDNSKGRTTARARTSNSKSEMRGLFASLRMTNDFVVDWKRTSNGKNKQLQEHRLSIEGAERRLEFCLRVGRGLVGWGGGRFRCRRLCSRRRLLRWWMWRALR